MVDAHYSFIFVDIGEFGRNSDGGIFMHFNLGKGLEKKILNVPPDTALPRTTSTVCNIGGRSFSSQNLSS